jgi:SagB-type dehydrogenase family enzyme
MSSTSAMSGAFVSDSTRSRPLPRGLPSCSRSGGRRRPSIRFPKRRSSAPAISRNWETEPARHYHEATKHSYESVRRRARPLDWANQPSPYKEYPEIPLEPLPPQLERTLGLGAGVTRRRRGYDFRTYSSAGALYPIEIYVATADGLFHFHPRELGLQRLRDDDVRDTLGGGETVLALTGILWRTAWKYDARGYRHLFWDAGTMLANLLELAPGEARVLTGFVDDEVNTVLGVDGIDEAAVALLQLR